MKKHINPLRNWLARKAVALARRVASDEHWATITHELGAPNMLHGLMDLRSRGLELHCVVDGGACVGNWTRLIKRIYPHARVLMIEPQASHQPVLQALATHYGASVEAVHALVGPRERNEVPFHVLDDGAGGTGSSVLAERSDVPRHVVKMPMTTIDRLVAERAWLRPDLIKLDVQGYELEVLEGARAALQSVPFVLLEVSTLQYNDGSPLIHDVLAWMRRAGYVTYDVFDLTRRRDGVLLQADLLFVRADSPMLASAG